MADTKKYTAEDVEAFKDRIRATHKGIAEADNGQIDRTNEAHVDRLDVAYKNISDRENKYNQAAGFIKRRLRKNALEKEMNKYALPLLEDAEKHLEGIKGGQGFEDTVIPTRVLEKPDFAQSDFPKTRWADELDDPRLKKGAIDPDRVRAGRDKGLQVGG